MAVEMLKTNADDPKLRKEFVRNIAELDQLVDEILLASRPRRRNRSSDGHGGRAAGIDRGGMRGGGGVH
ncbi:hypothetical protein ACVOMV_23200 [Mesorhizobium atlanticum]